MRTIGKRRRKLPGAAQLSSKDDGDFGSISQHVWTVPISDPANDSGQRHIQSGAFASRAQP